MSAPTIFASYLKQASETEPHEVNIMGMKFNISYTKRNLKGTVEYELTGIFKMLICKQEAKAVNHMHLSYYSQNKCFFFDSFIHMSNALMVIFRMPDHPMTQMMVAIAKSAAKDHPPT